jgi:hypothetical protein
MPERIMDILIKDNTAIVKTNIGGQKCHIKWVFIKMSWCKPLPPTIYSVDISGIGSDGKSVNESLKETPSTAKCLEIIGVDHTI